MERIGKKSTEGCWGLREEDPLLTRLGNYGEPWRFKYVVRILRKVLQFKCISFHTNKEAT